jgi:hypothetical protein
MAWKPELVTAVFLTKRITDELDMPPNQAGALLVSMIGP